MSWLTSLDVDWSQVLAFLMDCALKGSVVIATAAAIVWMLRRQTAAARHSVWSAAIAAQLVIPALAMVLPTWRVPLVEEPAWVVGTAASSKQRPPTESASSVETARPASDNQTTQTPTVGTESGPSLTTQPTTPAATAESWRPTPVMVFAGLWMLGAIAVLLRLAAGTAVVSRMAVRGHRVTDEQWLGLLHRLAAGLGIRRPVTLLRGDALGVPVTWGIVYPVVLLPEDADSWPEERRKYVLVHEMAHVKRLDAFTQLIAQFVLAIYWFNPLVWVAARQMRRERENACDDYVLTHGTKPSVYASDLLELVRDIDTDDHRSVAPAFAALAMARRSEFEGRMLSILNPRIRRNGLSRKGVLMSLITAILVITPLAAFSPFSLQQAAVNEGLPDSFKVSITGAPSTPVDSVTPQPPPTQESKTAGTRTESNSSGETIETCDRVTSGTSTSTSIHESNSRPNDRNIRFVQRTRGRCVEVQLTGRIAFTADERDVATMGDGARARFRELVSGSDREVVITSDAGQPRRTYLVNGRSAEYDADGRAWLASMIVKAMRESGYNANERVARLEQQGGLNRVLTEIDSIVSTGAKRTYYASLLELGRSIPDGEMARLFTRIKRDLAGSSGDLRSVLQKVAPSTVRQGESRTAFTDAISSIESDGDKSSLLTELAMTADRELLLDIAQVARSIGSDGDKSRVLIASAARYLDKQDARLRESFFGVAESVGSDGDKSRVLIVASSYGHADEAVTEAVIRGTLSMESDGDKANVLTSVAARKLLTSPKIKDAYLSAAQNIGSDGDRARVLRAALTGAP